MLFTSEHEQLRRSVLRFVDAEINPHADAWEAEGIFPAHALFKKLGAQGLLGIHKPVEYGGQGLDYSYELVMAEALGHADCMGVPLAIGCQTDMATPALARFGSDALRREFLAPSIAGDWVAAIGVSEPQAGSDVAAIKTRARHAGGDYVINGSKMWITNATQADWACLLCNLGDGPPHRNKTLLCVPLDTPGVTRGKRLDKLGMRSSDTAPLHFDEVRIPQRFRIGEEGRGFDYQMQQFQEERLWAGAASLVLMERTIRECAAYTGQRQAFGAPLLDNQYLHFKLAELQTEVEALRALVYRATELYVDGQDVTTLASMAKLKVGRLQRQVADSCLQFYGGMGFVNETPVSRFFRDGRLCSIGGGADEIMLKIISKNIGLFPRRG
ncbi:MAG: acyl-CoA dehydrogenase family protein [Betaproteobacteria bacterium]|nr:acyl-CoA dehydrogenase family protein [Betaproteobacteria bacterium]